VENSALALAEMAPILLTPRLCANGIPAPVMHSDWKKAVEGLVLAGEKAHKAALTRNIDAMLDVGETLSNACAHATTSIATWISRAEHAARLASRHATWRGDVRSPSWDADQSNA
jgi:hypothetical protein